jgi:uncharacterized membrane protein HdeD (DUF308 family)
MAENEQINQMASYKFNHPQRNLMIISGVISIVLGIIIFPPSFIKEMYLASAISLIVLVLGLILVAIAFGEKKMKNKLNPEEQKVLEIARLTGELVLKRDKKLLKELAKH